MNILHVSRKEFPIRFVEIKENIRKSSFISIDTELGGLSTNSKEVGGFMDTLEERYEKTKDSSIAFPIVQYGICCWEWKEDSYSFIVHPYQFYIFPSYPSDKKCYTKLPDRRLLLQVTCMKFIRQHGFDFNEWIDNGISYLSTKEQEEYKEVLDYMVINSRIEPSDSTNFMIKESSQIFADNVFSDVVDTLKVLKNEKEIPTLLSIELKEFHVEEAIQLLNTTIQEKYQGSNFSIYQTSTPILSPFIQLLLKKKIKETSYFIVTCIKDNLVNFKEGDIEKRILRVIEVVSSCDHTLQKIKAVMEQAIKVIQTEMDNLKSLEVIGFTNVIDEIRKSNIPIVGHNLLLDLSQSYEKFYERLPEDVDTFAMKLSQWLPLVFDTKHMVTMGKQKNAFLRGLIQFTSLDEMYQSFINANHSLPIPPIIMGSKDEKNDHIITPQDKKSHQAAIDAYMTGIVFLKCLVALGFCIDNVIKILKKRNNSIEGYDELIDLSNHLTLGKFEPYFSIKLPGPNERPNRDDYIRMSNFNTNARSNDIIQYLCKHLDIVPSQVHIYWENESNVVIKLDIKDALTKLLLLIRNNDPFNDKTSQPNYFDQIQFSSCSLTTTNHPGNPFSSSPIETVKKRKLSTE